MNRTIALILIVITLLVGCQIGKEVKPSEMNPNDLPDERAFQDEFTREFLQSAEETRPGYYPFLSKTGRYKMDFPAQGIIGDRQYTLNKKNFEGLVVGVLTNNDVINDFTLFYFGGEEIDNLDHSLDAFQKRVGKEVEFEEIEDTNKVIYYNTFERNNFYNHIAYIQNKENSGAIELIYSIDCLGNDQCSDKSENDKEIIHNWLKTIQFINKDGMNN